MATEAQGWTLSGLGSVNSQVHARTKDEVHMGVLSKCPGATEAGCLSEAL